MNLATLHRSANVALLAAVSLAAFGCNKKHPDVVATPPPVVLVSQPVERTVNDYQVFTARTQAVEAVDIKTRVNGFLTKVLFKDGANVKEGDILFQSDDRPYKATLDQAKASLSQAKASLDRARANLVEKQAYYEEGHKLWELDVKAISQQNLATR